jgi:hypothetical protein
LKLDETILQDLENNSCDVPLSVLDEISKIKDKDNQKDVYSKYLNNEITRDEIRIIKPQNVENFARENLDNKPLEQSFDFEENTPVETNEKKITPGIKFDFIGKPGQDSRCIDIEDCGTFYFYNYGLGENKIFKQNKEYKITIEEI